MSDPVRLLEDLEPYLDDLSTWETEFVENITTRIASKQELTEKQLAKLEEVVERHTRWYPPPKV